MTDDGPLIAPPAPPVNMFGGEVVTIEQMIAQAKPLERVLHICVDGALMAEFDEAEADLKDRQRTAKPDADASVAEGDGGVLEAAQRVERIRDRMKAKTYPFRFRAMKPLEGKTGGPRDAYAELVDRHSTGEELRNPDGTKRMDPTGKPVRALGDAYAYAAELIARTCVSPVMTEEQVRAFLAALENDAQMERMTNVARAVCTGAVDIPFSQLASKALKDRQRSEPAD